ncbi:MAG: sigma 54-interacting transcriptional regulator [Opitutaceae bacterium]|nr:sigma 54-interacting transcriptional regulator [Opitutaceae bacterium]
MPISPLFLPEEREFAEAMAVVNAANPFLPERIEAERRALGSRFTEKEADWNLRPPAPTAHPNVMAMIERCGLVWRRVASALKQGRQVTAHERALYEEVAGYWLYHSYATYFDRVILDSLSGAGDHGRVGFYAAFRQDFRASFGVFDADVSNAQLAELGGAVGHAFACAFQIRRAFHNIFQSFVGRSAPMARLRASLWQSLFTHDLGRYRRVLFSRMGDYATMITGPSGTGKELVARALGLSRYVAWESKRASFATDFARGFFPLHLAALSPTLIESELFGHRRGAFTGALADRAGWMEVCPPTGAVFLDEIGEVDPAIQVKLLRVLQARTFQPLGSTETLPFRGKIIAATNRDLAAEIRAGRFREDFYYRLCSDQIATPSLREQLDACPGDLVTTVQHVALRLVGPEECERFAPKALAWIEGHLGLSYAWPGNFRELEQCLRNLLLRGDYRPAGPLAANESDWTSLLSPGRLTEEEILRRYTRHVYQQAGSYEEAARRLGIDRRTVKSRVIAS